MNMNDITSDEVAEIISTTTDETEASNEPVQEASASEDTTEHQEQEHTPEEWFRPGQFKTKEDALRSYDELVKDYHRKAGELAALKRNAQDTQYQRGPVDETKWFAEEVQKNPVEAIRKVVNPAIDEIRHVAKAAQLQTEYAKLAMNPEFQELESTMKEIAMQNQDLIAQNDLQYDPRVLHLLFYAARGLKQEQRTAVAEATGKKKGEAAALRKSKAKVEGSSSTKGNVSKPFEKLSLEEMERELRKQGLAK